MTQVPFKTKSPFRVDAVEKGLSSIVVSPDVVIDDHRMVGAGR
jgi:hypothetical protein